eukprot:17767-Rhodomonas_salina.3
MSQLFVIWERKLHPDARLRNPERRPECPMRHSWQTGSGPVTGTVRRGSYPGHWQDSVGLGPGDSGSDALMMTPNFKLMIRLRRTPGAAGPSDFKLDPDSRRRRQRCQWRPARPAWKWTRTT